MAAHPCLPPMVDHWRTRPIEQRNRLQPTSLLKGISSHSLHLERYAPYTSTHPPMAADNTCTHPYPFCIPSMLYF